MFKKLNRNIAFAQANDPVAPSYWEVVLCYPGLHALYMHRLAHYLHKRLKWRLIARIISHISRCLTGIEIHPGALIADEVFIDHGMGVVIGETTVIHERVVIYQGVSLGGRSMKAGSRRHPTLMSDVIIASHAQVLGDIVIGRGSRIAAGSIVLDDVPGDSLYINQNDIRLLQKSDT